MAVSWGLDDQGRPPTPVNAVSCGDEVCSPLRPFGQDGPYTVAVSPATGRNGNAPTITDLGNGSYNLCYRAGGLPGADTFTVTVTDSVGDTVSSDVTFTCDEPEAREPEFACNGLSAARGRHDVLLVIDSTTGQPNDHAGDDFRFEQSTAGPSGPWTLSTLSGTSATNPDCDATEPNPFTTGGAASGLAVVVSPSDLTRDTDYWFRTTHEFSASGDRTGEQLVCGPFHTTSSDDLACATASDVTQTGVTLTQPRATAANPYAAGACDRDAFLLEYGTTAGGPYPLSSSLPPVDGDDGPAHTLTGLTPGTTYYFRTQLVDAVDGVLETSPECTFTTAAVVPPNAPPTITGLDDRTGPVGSQLEDTFTVADGDGTVVSVTSSPAGATLTDLGGGQWRIAYTPAAVGSTTFTILATDDDGATASDDVTFTGTAVTTPDSPFRPGPCDSDGVGDGGGTAAAHRDVEGTLLCDVVDGDVVGSAIVEAVYDEDGVRTGTRVVDPATGAPYTPTGVLQPCATGTGGAAAPADLERDDEFLVLCSDSGPFIRRISWRTQGSAQVMNELASFDLAGNTISSPTGIRLCDEPPVGWEAVCYTTTAGGNEVLPGTKRHDDRFGPPGFRVFDADGNRVDDAPGYAQAVCETCCDQQVGEGCWDDNGTTRRWVSMRSADGTIRVTDNRTGALVPEANIVACDQQTTNRTTFVVVDGVQSHTIDGDQLVSWSIRVEAGGANIEVNGALGNFLPGAIIESAAEAGSTLTDAVSVVGQGGASRVFVTYVNRV